TKRAQSTVAKEIRKIETEELSLEAEKIATMAVVLGGQITRRYLPLLDTLVSQGLSLEAIALDIMDWYEARTATNVRLQDLEAHNTILLRELEDLKIF
ncbi:unnamed protein product, partial [marine sediment metagenome]